MSKKKTKTEKAAVVLLPRYVVFYDGEFYSFRGKRHAREFSTDLRDFGAKLYQLKTV